MAFDIFDASNARLPQDELADRIGLCFRLPRLYEAFAGRCLSGPPENAYDWLSENGNFARLGGDRLEGVVYRVERGGRVDFLAKWLHPQKRDGCYLPEVSGLDPVWNWRPMWCAELADRLVKSGEVRTA